MRNQKVKSQIKKAKRNGVDMVQLAMIRESARKNSEKIMQEYSDKAVLLTMSIACEILAHDYWEKSAKKRIPEFANKFWSLFEAVEIEVVDWQQIIDDLHDMTGIKFDVEWIRRNNNEN